MLFESAGLSESVNLYLNEIEDLLEWGRNALFISGKLCKWVSYVGIILHWCVLKGPGFKSQIIKG